MDYNKTWHAVYYQYAVFSYRYVCTLTLVNPGSFKIAVALTTQYRSIYLIEIKIKIKCSLKRYSLQKTFIEMYTVVNQVRQMSAQFLHFSFAM